MGVLFRHIGKIQGGDFENRRLVGNVEVSKQNFTMSKSTDYSGHPILGQLLSFIPKEVFKGCVVEEKSDKWYKQVKTWDHFVFMAYGVLTGSSSLREIIKNFTLFGSNLRHCGIFLTPRRSSISDANSRRNSSVFGLLYIRLYAHYQQYLSDSYLQLPINGEVAPNQVEIFDSTTVSLFTDVYKNCGRLPESGQQKGGIKAFTKIRLSERVPNFVCMKAAVTNEKLFLLEIDLPKGIIAVFDKGFQKFAQYKQWNESGVFYVTRMNDNANFRILKQRPLEEACEDRVQLDADIELTYRCPKNKKDEMVQARMVAYIDPASGKKLVFLTNLLGVKA